MKGATVIQRPTVADLDVTVTTPGAHAVALLDAPADGVVYLGIGGGDEPLIRFHLGVGLPIAAGFEQLRVVCAATSGGGNVQVVVLDSLEGVGALASLQAAAVGSLWTLLNDVWDPAKHALRMNAVL